MRAARFYGKEDIRFDEIDEPKVGEGEIKIAPAFVGICGTDLHEFMGGPNFCPVEPHPITGEKIPVGFGHEFSGVVTEVGKGVTDFKEGQHVVVQPTIACWECGNCKVGVENTCMKGGFVGLSGYGGGLADFVVVPSYKAIDLPKHVPLDVGALVEPLAVGWHAVSAANMEKGDRVLVMGGGPIGLSVIQAAKAKGASLVLCAELAPARQKFAKHFGADHIIDPTKEDVVARAIELSSKVEGKPPTGPDIALDCAGVPASAKAACKAVKGRGTVINVAIWEKDIPFNPSSMLVFSEVTYRGVLGYQKKDFEYVVGAVAKGDMNPAEMITKKIKLTDLVDEGIKTLINDNANHVKILVDLKA